MISILSGDKDDDDDDDADDKMQSSVMTGGEEGRQESQEQNEVDHGDFEMVVGRKRDKNSPWFYYYCLFCERGKNYVA